MLAKIAEAGTVGVHYIQLREKDLSARELEQLAKQALARLEQHKSTRLLVNSRLDVALAAGAHGVHLRAEDYSPAEARKVAALAGRDILVGVSCHSVKEVATAESERADLVVLGPIFSKAGAAQSSLGLEELRRACKSAKVPVMALGGVTLTNACECIRAGANGIAGIRLFQESDISALVPALQALG